MNYNAALPFFQSAQKYPDKLALFADGRSYTYRELLDRVLGVAGWLSAGKLPKRVGIVGSRSAEACIGVLASNWLGAAYLPISLKQPELGVIGLLKRSGLDALIADRTGSQMLTPAVLAEAPAKVLVVRDTAPKEAGQRVNYFEEQQAESRIYPPLTCGPDDVAYILYTSGSTGVPKGVMLPTKGIHHLLKVMQRMYPIGHEDRVAETTDITFDLTVYNMFVAWQAGASLHVIPQAQAMAPAKFVQEHEITTWLSVPAIAAFMGRMGLLRANSFPSLKYTFFAGEPLLASVCAAWQTAAPNSVVANLYGPTEATVVCIGQDYSTACTLTRDCVSIGKVFDGMKAVIANEDQFASTGTPGELLLGGPQLALGYMDDPEKTASRFVTIGDNRWYRTGDLASCDQNGVFHYLGRIDNQVKVLGYRVELEDIECHLRDASGCGEVAAVAWPIESGSASGVVGFLVSYQGSEEEIKNALRQRLPSYMVPARVHVLPKLPLNNNGKVDRSALVKMLERGAAV
jgi:D-alanine--poly(phosphoribitol) ligase subunit 1